MKKSLHLLFFLLLVIASLSAYSQKYRTAADTVKLNKEYVSVSNEIADLTAQLTIAKNNLPGYETKAANAGSNAQDAATISSDQAAKATNGSISDARSAKRKAKTAYKEAKDAKSASNNVSDQDNKIASLTSELNKKQERLQQLEAMRTAINAQAPPIQKQ
jgi:predicted  nucleic acid-binding Zn-ribbon protein